MPRKKKQVIKTNDVTSLEGLLQETYNDACSNITNAQDVIAKIENSTEPEDVDDYSKIAKEKTNALKIKDSGIRIKLEIAKLQSDIIKHSGNSEEALKQRGGVDVNDFRAVRKMIQDSANNNDDDTENK